MSDISSSPVKFSFPSSLSDSDDFSLVTAPIKNYVKELLKSRIFLGRYIERRLVTAELGYRDVVVVSPAETELKKDLEDVRKKIHLTSQNTWIGITDTDVLGYRPASLCVWTQIESKPFGVYWFQIKTVHIDNTEVMIRLRCLRHITDSFLEAEPILTGGINVKSSKINDSSVEALAISYTEIKETLKGALSISNVKEFLTFIFAFIIAIFTGSTAFVGFLGNFVLSLIREMSYLVKNSTPFMLGVLDFFSKIVGGFYILIAMIFRPAQQPQSAHSQRRRISYVPYESDDRCFD